jgi:VWFA-related protein
MTPCGAIGKLIVVSAVSFLPLPVAGLEQQDQPDFTIRSDVRLVLLDAAVKDRKGNPVSGLSRDNFKVFEDGRPQSLQVFVSKDTPVTVGIIVDESFSMRPKRDAVLTAAETFVKESNPGDEVFVLNFNDTVIRGLAGPQLFSGDIEQLSNALHRGVPVGKTALNDAIVEGLQQLEQGKFDKKTLIVISDGGDNASRHTHREMLDAVVRSSATIYTIGLYDTDDPDRNPGMLRELARISGGEAYFPATPPDTIPVCQRIARDIRARYTIGYVPPSGGANALRHIRVRVEAPEHGKLTAITRSSYRYEEASSQKKQTPSLD